MLTSEVLAQPQVPADVLKAYCGDRFAYGQPIGNGEINETFLVVEPSASDTDADHRIIVQKINTAVFKRGITSDFVVVTDHLTNEGWEVPRAVPTEAGAVDFVDQEGSLWRAMTFVESDGDKPLNSESPDLYTRYGGLLAAMHASLAKLDHEPHSIDHFHDTPYIAQHFIDFADKLPDAETKAMADVLLDAYATLELPEDTENQLIHADPKTDNMLFRSGEPFTYIDWDTLMEGTIWVDIGDMLRSVVEDSVLHGEPLPLAKLQHFSEGYRCVAMPDVSPEQFQEWVIAATQRIAVELGMRYLVDIVDGRDYWSYDETQYPTRYDYCAQRAATQITIYNSLSQLLAPGDAHV